MDRYERRFRRQFRAIARSYPPLTGRMAQLHQRRFRLIRVPIAIFLIAGGIFSILPIFGLWMLPLGLLLLAVDIPLLRPYVSSAIIRARRFFRRWKLRLRRGIRG